MRKLILSFLFPVICGNAIAQQNCEDKQHPPPVFTDSLQKVFDESLSSSYSKYQNDSTNAEHIVWYGRRTAYLGNYKEAIDIYTRGMQLFPKDPRFLRHRAHRFITLRCFDKAIADLEKATEMIRDKTDEVEADGLPNALNIPTTTLHFNIWYHLGLAYYLKGEFEKALYAYQQNMLVADNNDSYVATLNWLYITLRKLGKNAEAEQKLQNIDPDIQVIENKDYLDILLMYRRNNDKSLVEKTNSQQSLGSATLGYALGNYYLLKGQKEKAREIFQAVLKGNQWASFGFIAAEKELERMK